MISVKSINIWLSEYYYQSKETHDHHTSSTETKTVLTFENTIYEKPFLSVPKQFK
jgi:hypothetical protein